jgi:glycosyltransferase involved in cell wall biosynthesis
LIGELIATENRVVARLTLVIPVYNEAASLAELDRQLTRVTSQLPLSSEFIYVDDGSRDGSWEELTAIVARTPTARAIRFRRNFGKAAALAAGLKAATGDAILMLDADLQDDPAEIPNFLEALSRGFDVVNGWKERRLDPWHKVYPSRVFNWMVSRLTGLKLHDHNCGIKLFRKEVAAELHLYGELHRFIPVLAHARGFRVTEIPVHHRPREHGVSKYGWKRFARGFLDLLTVSFLMAYRQRPLHILGGVGLVFLAIGLGGLTYLAAIWLLMHAVGALPAEPIGDRPLLAYSIAFTLLGGQAVTLGLLAELLVHYTSREQDAYSVAEEISAKS